MDMKANQQKMEKVETGVRRLEYVGKCRDSAILVGNHGNVHFTAKGEFQLNGNVYCPKYTMKVIASGSGRITLKGICRVLIVVKMEGDCVLDLTELSSKEMRCTVMAGSSQLIVGRTRILSGANLRDSASILLTQPDTIIGSNVIDHPRVHRAHEVPIS